MKWIVLLFFIGIVGALVSAGRAMLHDGRNGAAKSNRMVRALAWRVGLSVLLFIVLLVSYKMGWIHPTGVPLKA